MKRPTVYSAPDVGEQETLYLRSTIYASATIYREFVDPNEYDPNDIPPDNSLQLVPLDRDVWFGAFDGIKDQLGIVQTEEQAGWIGAFDDIKDQSGIVQTEEQAGWIGAFDEMEDTAI